MIGETKEDGVDQDEIQTTDTSAQVEEDKEEKSTVVTRKEVQTNDMVVG